MTNQELFSDVDHTLLKPKLHGADRRAVRRGSRAWHRIGLRKDDVPLAKKLLDGKAKVCAVIGFPLGAMSTAAKAFEAAEAVRDGADEIEMGDHRPAQGRQNDYVLEGYLRR